MTVKMIIGVFFAFSYLFVSVMTTKKPYFDIPEDDYPNNMKGVDISASCGNTQAMEDTCMKIGKACGLTDGKKPSAPGFPKCHVSKIQLQKKDGTGIILEKAKFIHCSWQGVCGEYYFGKGKNANKIMSVDCNPASCLPYTEYSYPCN